MNSDPNPDKGLGDTIHVSGNAMLAFTGPGGTIADVPVSVSPERISTYVVRSGDTLSEIGDMFGVSVNTIIWANDLKSSTDLQPGDTLIILPISGTEHIIASGDTLKSIAKKYHADAGEVAQYNGLDAGDTLAIGTTIIIPGGEIVVSAPTKKSNHTHANAVYEPYIGGSGTAYPGYYTNPVPGAVITQTLHGWNAIDLGAPIGTPIRAAAAGTVLISKSTGAWNGGYGNYVVISHANNSQTLYAHMTRTSVASGQKVTTGEIIGYLGSTGLSTGPHLHFEVRGAANPLRNCSVGSVCRAQ